MVKKGLYLFWILVFSMSVAIGNAQAFQINDKGKTVGNVTNAKNSAVQGMIKENGTLVKNALVMIRGKGKANWIHIRTDVSGSFTSELPDGAYAIKGIVGSSSNVYSTNETFTVKDWKIKGAIDGEINLTKKEQSKKPLVQPSNLIGVVKDGNKGLKADLVFLKDDEYQVEAYTVSSKGDGSFSASLPDGDYFLNGIEIGEGIYIYELGFKIVGGKLLVDGTPQDQLSITIPVNKYAGKVEDSSGPIADAHIVLEKVGNEYDEWIEEVVTNKQGEFSLRALSDGSYSLSVYHSTYSSWKHILFEVVNGDIYIEGQKSNLFKVAVPDVNVKGTLLDGKKPVSNGNILINGETPEGDYNYFYAEVNSKGEFQYRLKDGLYNVTEINEELRFTRVDVSFEIREGKLVQNGKVLSTLDIDLPPLTFFGKLLDSGTAAQGRVEIVNDENNEWFNGVTDKKAIFALRLKDGIYKVRGGSLYDGQEEFWATDTFEIIKGKLFVDGEARDLLELNVPPISLHGIVKEGDQALTYGFYSVCSNDQSFCSGRSLNTDGTFALRLADGDYVFNSVNLQDGTFVPINQAFSILDGKTYVNGQLQESLEIAVPPVTLIGALTESGNPVTGSLSISKINVDGYPPTFWGRTNEEGRFNFRLPDGDYKVSNVNLDDNTQFNAEKVFSIVSGKLFIDGQLQDGLEIAIPPVTLKGTLTEAGKPLAGQLSITEIYNAGNPLQLTAWANEEGVFQSRLPDGTYRVSNVYFQESAYSPEIIFQIQSGQLYVKGQQQDGLNIAVPPVSLKGVLMDSGNPISGGISIKAKGNTEYPISFWAYANQDGEFKYRLPDGNYQVYNVSLNDGTSFNPSFDFSIVSGVLYVNGEQKDELTIAVPPISLLGNVHYGEEPVVQGYVAINPKGETGGMGYTVWIQNGFYQYRLPDGDYVISYVQDYQHGFYSICKNFTILNGKILVDGLEVKTLDLNLQDWN